jgi:hypothetical protein
MDTREFEGYFWHPKDASKVLGRLKVSDDDLILTVERSEPRWGQQPPVLFGDCQGYSVTLFQGFTGRISPRPYETTLSLGMVVLGDHLPSPRSRRYRSISAQIEDLDELIGVSGLRFESDRERRVIEWEPTPILSARLREVEIQLHSAASFEYVSDFEFHLQHGSWVSFSSSTRKSLDTWRNRWLGGMESLIALSVDEPTKVLHWTASQNSSVTAPTSARTIEVLTHTRPNFGPRYPRTGLWQPILSFADIDTSADTVLRGFYRFRQKYPQPSEILFEYQVLAGALTPSDRFLYMARFLESLHRIKDPGTGARKTRSFRERLLALLSSDATAATPWLGAASADLADLVVKTRNYYVHYNPKDREKAVHDLDLEELGDRLWQIVRACLLHEIGLSDDEIARALDRDPLSARLRSAPQPFP